MSVQRARLILNPAAGSDEALANAALLNEKLSKHFGPIEIVLTIGAGDCEAAARRAVEDGCDTLFIGGGDGTLNEAVNGVASVSGGLERITFGLVPLGTGNDFAQALGLPTEAAQAVEFLTGDQRVAVDLGRLNNRHFVNISGGGFIAEVSEAVTPQMKSIAGRLAYLLGGAQALMEFEPVGMNLRAEPDGEHITSAVYAFAVCNSRMIGGGRLIAPSALIDDGLLDVCIIDAMPTLDFVGLLREVAAGDHVDDPRVRYLRAARATIDLDRPVLVNTDGEVLEASRCEYEILPRAAHFIAGSAPFAGTDPG